MAKGEYGSLTEPRGVSAYGGWEAKREPVARAKSVTGNDSKSRLATSTAACARLLGIVRCIVISLCRRMSVTGQGYPIPGLRPNPACPRARCSCLVRQEQETQRGGPSNTFFRRPPEVSIARI